MSQEENQSICALRCSAPISTLEDNVNRKFHIQYYEDIFEKKNVDILLKHHPYNCIIELQYGTQLPFSPIYNLSQLESTALRKYIDENLSIFFMRYSKSPVKTPILFVRKSGSLRTCINYRGLNKIIMKNWYPLPLIAQILINSRTQNLHQDGFLKGL